VSHAHSQLRVSLLAQPTTPQRANKEPYLQGIGAPRHYPHTLIAPLANTSLLVMCMYLIIASVFDVAFKNSSGLQFQISKNIAKTMLYLPICYVSYIALHVVALRYRNVEAAVLHWMMKEMDPCAL
jgi:hypothetical protein